MKCATWQERSASSCVASRRLLGLCACLLNAGAVSPLRECGVSSNKHHTRIMHVCFLENTQACAAQAHFQMQWTCGSVSSGMLVLGNPGPCSGELPSNLHCPPELA